MPIKPSAVRNVLLKSNPKNLAVKDGLREVRFNLRQGARKLVDSVEAAAQRGDHSGVPGLAMLSEPLNLAVRMTASLLNNVDHAAVDLLSSDGPYRAMSVPLRPSSSYFEGPAGDLRAFTTDHHWRFRHWLELTQRGNVFVHEQAVERAGSTVLDSKPDRGPFLRPAPLTDMAWAPPVADLLSVAVIQALAAGQVLTQPAMTPGDEAIDPAELAELQTLGAVCVVLAGEIYPLLMGLDTRAKVAHALRLADEVAQADRSHWGRALRSADPMLSMSRWLSFVRKHV